MKYNIVFSLPVHEKFEVITDQLFNIISLNPDCAVVLHLSPVFDYAKSQMSKKKFEDIVQSYFADKVFINPISIRTGWFDIIQAHIHNFKYVSSIIEFNLFSPVASNELFIRRGLYEYIRNFDCGIMGGVIYGKSSTKRGAKLANKDEALIAIMQEISSDKIYWSQIEGSFYRKSLFQKMTDIIEHSFNYENVTVFYEREEIYFPTVLWAIARSESLNVLDGGNYTFVPWSRKNLLTRLSEVIKLIKDPNCHYFSVKRVNRMLNDYVRMYIRQSNGYGDVMAKIVEGVETQPTDELLKLERKSYFKQSVRARWNSFAYYFTHTKEMFFVFKDKFSK